MPSRKTQTAKGSGRSVASRQAASGSKTIKARRPSAAIVDAATSALKQAVLSYKSASNAAKVANNLKTEAADAILSVIDDVVEPDAEGKITYTFEEGGSQHRVTIVQGESLSFDEAAIRAGLGDEEVDSKYMITVQVFSEDLFMQDVNDGTIPKKDVPKYIVRTPKKPFPKVT